MSRPLAPFIEASSISGLEIAASAAVSARFSQDGAHVGKVEIDKPFLDHQVRDAGYARIEDLVGHGKGIGKGRLFIRNPKQILVGNNKKRVHNLVQFDDACL